MGPGSAFLLLVSGTALNSLEIRLLLAATRRSRSHGVEDWHDVVPVDVLRGE